MDETRETPAPLPRRENIRAEQFDQFLLEMARIPNSYNRFPQKIDIGPQWTARMDELVAETMAHPQHVEHARTAVVRRGEIVWDTKSFVGMLDSTGQVTYTKLDVRQRAHIANIDGALRFYSESDVPLLQIHTHGDEFYAASPPDFKRLILDRDDPKSIIMEGIITPSLRILMFRTLETPDLSPERAKSNVDRWTEAVLAKYRDANLFAHEGESFEQYKYRVSYEAMTSIAKATKVRLYSAHSGSEYTVFE
jgi:hypothetical protein